MVGKTHTDELAYSLNGENVHYGTPINPRAPGRIPGGSSSGSAAAVAGGLVDFAIGTDCGGSVRLPASYCGILGFRPTHGRISLNGIVPLASSFDTVGWFTRDATLLQRVGQVLLTDDAAVPRPHRLLLASDAFAVAGNAVTEALQPAVAAVTAAIGQAEQVNVSAEGLAEWMQLFRIIQGAEIWANHGAWIRTVQPSFGPGIRERFAWTSSLDPADVAAARERREQVAAHLDVLLGNDAILCLPTTPGIAPLRDTPSADLEAFRARALSLLCIAGLARLPQVSLPLGMLDGCPLGLSLVAPRGADTTLLTVATITALSEPTVSSSP
jgi:amidase